ncbi:hypothetical protein ZWY2020_030832 [Hordeum vulgare]|nr:hypothetical protein ZWY2020_030832 [Hordeum vulgare]
MTLPRGRPTPGHGGELLPKGSGPDAAVRHEGWMVRYGRRKIGRSFLHTRYFVLDNKLLAYYKKQPKDNNMLSGVKSIIPHSRNFDSRKARTRSQLSEELRRDGR